MPSKRQREKNQLYKERKEAEAAQRLTTVAVAPIKDLRSRLGERKPTLYEIDPINLQPGPSTSSQGSNYPIGPSLEGVTCWRRSNIRIRQSGDGVPS